MAKVESGEIVAEAGDVILPKWAPKLIGASITISILIGTASVSAIIRNGSNISAIQATHKSDKEADKDFKALFMDQMKSIDERAEKRYDKIDNRIDFMYGEFNDQNEKLDKILNR